MNSELPILGKDKLYNISGKTVNCVENGVTKSFEIPDFAFVGQPPAVCTYNTHMIVFYNFFALPVLPF
jgi:hypothetical protein